MADEAELLTYKINHLVLPPKLPQECDASPENECALLAHVLTSGRSFLEEMNELASRELLEEDVLDRWELVVRMLTGMENVTRGEGAAMDAELLASVVNAMKEGDALPLHIGAQNAGVILRKIDALTLTYESFFASLPAGTVTGTVGKVVSQFPSTPRLPFPADPALVKVLCGYLAEMHTHQLSQALPGSWKAGSKQNETRESTNPWYITHFLVNVVRAFSADHPDESLPYTTYVVKRLNDHVLWKNAELPWRRSPILLVLKVALQTTLVGIPAQYGYKAFMAYMLGRLLNEAARPEAEVPDDMLYIINTKIALRTYKLRNSVVADRFPIVGVISTSERVAGELEQRWKQTQLAEGKPIDLSAPSKEEIRDGSVFTLQNSRSYLDAVIARDERLRQTSDVFDAAAFEQAMPKLRHREAGALPEAFEPTAELHDVLVGIQDVTTWFESSEASDWMSNSQAHERWDALDKLMGCSMAVLKRFMSAGAEADPELFSTAFLNVMNLWVILDKTAVEAIPLLLEYTPELTVKPLSSLLLRTKASMQRLLTIEQYLTQRYDTAKYGSVYALDPSASCADAFGARYAEADPEICRIRLNIDARAERGKTSKRRELKALEDRRADLISRAAARHCSYYQSHSGVSRHSNYCQKCRMEADAQDLSLPVFEEPLPGDRAFANVLLFELNLPPLFSSWRSTTYKLVNMFAKTSSPERFRRHTLRDYVDIQSSMFGDLTAPLGSRITLASDSESFLLGHYRNTRMPCDEEDAIKNHAPRWWLYDTTAGDYLQQPLPAIDLHKHCGPVALPSPYDTLQWTVEGTSHKSNLVIARQSECPAQLSLHEWEAFGHLRAGVRLQWHNIILQLEIGVLKLADSAVHILMRQAALQAERATRKSYISRDAHATLTDEQFGSQALEVLRRRCAHCANNWEEGWVASTLSLVGHRVYELSTAAAVRTDARKFLRDELRPLCMKWMRQIQARLQAMEGTSSSNPLDSDNTLRDCLIQVCLAARDTYHFRRGAFHNAGAVADYLECGFILRQHLPHLLSTLPEPLCALARQDAKLSLLLLDPLMAALEKDSGGLDLAVGKVWEGFQRSRRNWRWARQSCWVACRTSTRQGMQARTLHVDLVKGAIFVDGASFQALPHEILQHRLYKEVFPKQVQMRVVPSTMSGMTYQCQSLVNGYEIHFRLDNKDLIIRMRDENHEVAEFLPTHKLKNDVPNSLLAESIVIHRLDTGQLDFVPRAVELHWDPSSSAAWTLDSIRRGAAPMLVSLEDGRRLMRPRSVLVSRLSRAFQALETSRCDLLVTYSPSSKAVSVNLPRYGLEFFFDPKRGLVSKEFPDYAVAASRDIGTLYGVEKVVLQRWRGPPQQRILVPAGPITVKPKVPHPHITLNPATNTSGHVDMHVFDLDELTGKVKPTGNLDSVLTLAYLHAVSSSHRRDPFIGERGVDRALSMLESASAFAFTQLSPADTTLLSQLASLSPGRQFYPKHLKVMETTEWHPSLSPLSQSELFAPLVADIGDYARRKADLESSDARRNATPLPKRQNVDTLPSRAYYRNARLCPHTANRKWAQGRQDADSAFSWPDPPDPTAFPLSVLEVAGQVRAWEPTAKHSVELWDRLIKWNAFSSVADDCVLSRPCQLSSSSQPKIWFTLYQKSLCTTDTSAHKYFLMFILAFLLNDGLFDHGLVETILNVAVMAGSSNLPPLRGSEMDYELADGWKLTSQKLEAMIEQYRVSFDHSCEHRLPRKANETPEDHRSRCSQEYWEHWNEQVEELTTYLSQQWPCSHPRWPSSSAARYTLIDMPGFRKATDKLFRSMHRNRQLRQQVTEIQRIIDSAAAARSLTYCQPPSVPRLRSLPQASYELPSMRSLMVSRQRPITSEMPIRVAPASKADVGCDGAEGDLSPLKLLVDRVPTETALGLRYQRELAACVEALPNTLTSGEPSRASVPQTISVPALRHGDIERALNPQSPFEWALFNNGNWPNTNTLNLLSLLSYPHRRETRASGWKQPLTLFALSLLRIQRERRLDALEDAEFAKELATSVGEGYDPFKVDTDWLLIQIDGDFALRPVQADLAFHMMSSHNRVTQLNMGEGKSSVIVPITSVTCANGEDLVCVFVLKPLYAQMFHLLSQRVSGLANRRVFHLPFSRDTAINTRTLQSIRCLFEDCAQSGGVLLCQPEHLLSLQLMASSMLCSGNEDTDVHTLSDIQRWVTKHSRYILDESDEILSHKYQLIYTIGNAGPLDGHPERWRIIQQVLGLISVRAEDTLRALPDGIDIEHGSNAIANVRRTRVLSDAAWNHLSDLCVTDIIDNNAISPLSFRSYLPSHIAAVRQFVTTLDIRPEEAQITKNCSGDAYTHLLLLRGLFAHGILRLVFQKKRWRVNYGVDLSRSRLAIPYRAKDSPAPRAEFGHPDVTIVLTSLSYYSSGLTDEELDTTFDQLEKTDSPALRYEGWVKGSALALGLRSLSGVNRKDTRQRSTVYAALRRTKPVIDFYLSECVFPKEARQYPHKLTTNPWDLAREKSRPTTGFSGTRDNRYTLPTSIVQEDLPPQQHTDALVLNYIRRSENQTVICKDYDAAGIIAEAVNSEPVVSVILDVGAQVLELNNEEMAGQWLASEARADIEAAVFFGSDDELYVRTRNGRVEPLRRSFYREQLGKTLVYLDEAHTRGTDLKLPDGARALVTLGPKLTKDKLMQGCMRMRKLGRPGGHSVQFLASSEIQRCIRKDLRQDKERLDSTDVLVWTICETIRQTVENGTLWAAQGLDFDARREAWEKFTCGAIDEDELISVLRQREAYSLEELYGPDNDSMDVDEDSTDDAPGSLRPKIRRRCAELGFSLQHSGRLLEEQERELAHEKETEREVQRAPFAEAKPHKIDSKLRSMIGKSTFDLSGYHTLLDCLEYTSVHEALSGVSKDFFQSTEIVATRDFMETVELSRGASNQKDAFLRSVQWIVSTQRSPGALLLISPSEANAIIDVVRQSKHVRLHLYAPQLSRNLHVFSELTFLATPSSTAATYETPASAVMRELDLFSGSLFLQDARSYNEVCALLGLYLDEIPQQLKGQIAVDGFVPKQSVRAKLGIEECLFQKSPSAVLKTLVDLRRKGLGFMLTHVGQILHGMAVGSDDF
ncbi:uncharacterized protein SCHCODRAFT_02569139 [Schizophyllum commune H4-8]|nr:uncharacterized protein SCHCODRAFT_02569139 [Schizophyllum commune H4-8]KAI5896513.1 hypothetical protein SCHCODRAFT_02569139 [Schizophyllum commune H4-8]